jgi:hypothetical protein
MVWLDNFSALFGVPSVEKKKLKSSALADGRPNNETNMKPLLYLLSYSEILIIFLRIHEDWWLYNDAPQESRAVN